METKERAISYFGAGTAASSFHVSDTIDWSSLSAQTKNRVVVVRVPVKALERVGPELTQSDDRARRSSTSSSVTGDSANRITD